MAAAYRHHVAAIPTNSTTITVDYTGLTHSSGDVLVCIVPGYSAFGSISGATLTWTQRLNLARAGPFVDIQMRVFTATSDGSADSFDLTHGQNDQHGYCVMSVSGADTTTPLDGTPTIAGNSFGSAATPSSPSITDLAIGVDALLVSFCGVWPTDDGASSFTPPSGMDERVDLQAWDSWSVATDELTSSAATGAKDWTESPSLGTGAWIAGSIAIRPAAGAAATSRHPWRRRNSGLLIR